MTFTGTKTEIQQYLYKLNNFSRDTVFDLKIEKHRNKRSLDANNYAWHLINEIANVLRMSKEEVYLQMLKSYGQRDYVSMLSNVNASDYFKYYEEQGVFKNNGNTFRSYLIFKGTSQYDSREMSIFIDGLVQEARQLGIETLEDIEIKNLLKEMEKNGMGRY